MSRQAVHTTTFTVACDHCEKSTTWSVEGIQDSPPTPVGWLSYYIAVPADVGDITRMYCSEPCAIDGFVSQLRKAYPPAKSSDPLERLIAL